MTRASLSGLAFLIDLSQEGDLPGGGRRPPSAARLRRLRATLENGLRRFLSSAPSRVRIHARATKKRAVRARFSYQPGGERGIRRAAGAALDPLRACGACGLRWKTLARFLSSAPSRVRIHARATKKRAVRARFSYQPGGERGIRTLGTLACSTVFKTAAFNRSAISPACWVMIASNAM